MKYLLLLPLLITSVFAQMSFEERIKLDRDFRYKVATTKPSQKMLNYMWDEYIAFFHFSPNNFTGRQWGKGDEDPKIFNPTELDTDQWMKVIKESGATAIILTAKHHDGFCLWPSKFTNHSVKSSPWKNGQGDIVKMAKESAKKYGLKFGIYYSASDGNAPSYGTEDYHEFAENQLKELFTNYGKLDYIWFDGATPPWVKKKERPGFSFQIDRWKKLISIYQPEALSNWVDYSLIGNEKIKTPKSIFYVEPNGPDGTVWRGKEALTSIRDLWLPIDFSTFWFYHPLTIGFLRSKYNLRRIYYKSVGRGTTLNLNFSPNKKGLIPTPDAKRGKEFGEFLKATFSNNLLKGAIALASNSKEGHEVYNLLDGSQDTYWTTEDWQEEAYIEITLPQKTKANLFVLQEAIQKGQRIEEFSIDYFEKNKWKELGKATTVGSKRIVKFFPRKLSKIRINIKKSRFSPTLNNIGLYLERWK